MTRIEVGLQHSEQLSVNYLFERSISSGGCVGGYGRSLKKGVIDYRRFPRRFAFDKEATTEGATR
jgi:hypothetical protein